MKISKKHICAVVALVALLASLIGGAMPAAASNGPWWNASWQYRTEITIDNSNVGENLTDFPLLVCLDSGDIDYTHTEDDGSDIRFIDADGTTQLPREIEDWNEAGTSYVWVQVDIDADPATELIYMYYGNPAATEPAIDSTYGAENVWSNGYVGVWHLHDDFLDSTANDNDGTNAGSDDVAGRIGDAQDFEQDNSDWITVSDDDSLDITEGTLEAWVMPEAPFPGTGSDEWDRIIGRENNNLTEDYCLLIAEGSPGTQGAVDLWSCDPGPGTRDRAHGATALSAGSWYHVAGVLDDTADMAYIYRNGSQDGSAADNNTFCLTDYDVLIGASDRDFFDGIIDEVRISSVPRSDEWIEATYDCTNNCAAFTTFATEEGYFDCTFTDPVRDTELKINTEQGTFQFLTPISTGATYDSGLVTASHMRVRMDGYGQARINIWHRDGSTRLWVSAICGPADLCSASLKDLSSGTLYRLRDNRGIEP